ncbi:MAG: hypothetical protein ACP5Q0_03115, partial [Halothiobacillus sp.]
VDFQTLEIAPGATWDIAGTTTIAGTLINDGTIIETAAGRMWGSYGFVDEHGDAFRVEIPLFHLVAPSDYRPLH